VVTDCRYIYTYIHTYLRTEAVVNRLQIHTYIGTYLRTIAVVKEQTACVTQYRSTVFGICINILSPRMCVCVCVFVYVLVRRFQKTRCFLISLEKSCMCVQTHLCVMYTRVYAHKCNQNILNATSTVIGMPDIHTCKYVCMNTHIIKDTYPCKHSDWDARYTYMQSSTSVTDTYGYVVYA
jgi:hypothetical protein